MKNLQRVLMLALAAIMITACSKSGLKDLTGVKMDTESAVEKAKSIAADNIKPDQWKIISVSWTEGMGRDELSNNVSIFTYEMVDKDGRVWNQSFMSDLGWKATELTDAGWEKWHKDLNAKDVPAIDMTNLNPAEVMKDIEAAKALIPAEFEFKSMDSYEMNTYDDPKVSIKLNVVEKGKETVSNAGQTSTVFYELDFRKNAKGKMELVKP